MPALCPREPAFVPVFCEGSSLSGFLLLRSQNITLARAKKAVLSRFLLLARINLAFALEAKKTPRTLAKKTVPSGFLLRQKSRPVLSGGLSRRAPRRALSNPCVL